MAIQAQNIYTDTSGFGVVDWGGGGGGSGFSGGVGIRNEMLQQQQMFGFRIPQQQQQQNQHQVSTNTLSFSLDSVVQKQSLEIDHYIRSQSERLRLILREQNKREFTELLKKFEARTSVLLKKKDEEISRAANRTSQLESLALKIENEARMWQNVARQNELHVVSLLNSIQTLQQSVDARAGLYGGGDVVDDSESCCESGGGGSQMMMCRVCQIRKRCVVLVPCRHLCCCTVCVNMIEFCPVCQTAKKATVEALLH